MEKFNFSQINWKWVGISILIFAVAQIILGAVFGLIGILTLGLGFIIFSWLVKPLVYLVTGFVTGILSPGITLFEPAIGSLIATLVGSILHIFNYRGGFFMIIFSGALAFIISLIGAYMGEKKSINKKETQTT